MMHKIVREYTWYEHEGEHYFNYMLYNTNDIILKHILIKCYHWIYNHAPVVVGKIYNKVYINEYYN